MRADRLLSVVMLLRHRGRMTAASLATELEVSQRTVLRDIEALSLSGVPIYADRGRGGGFSLLPGYRTDLTGLTLAESQALMASGAGRLDSPALVNAMRKVAAAIPDVHRDAVHRAARRVLVRPDGFLPNPTADSAVLADLQRAVMVGLRIRMRYRRLGEEGAERVVDPVGLVMGGDTWYLVALPVDRDVGTGPDADESRTDEERMYRVSRIDWVRVLDHPAHRPDDVDLETVWERRRDAFRGRFEPVTVSGRVRDDRRRTSTLRADVTDTGPAEDGWRPVRMEFADRRYAVLALWNLGPDVVVESPADIRTEMIDRVHAIADSYGLTDRDRVR